MRIGQSILALLAVISLGSSVFAQQQFENRESTSESHRINGNTWSKNPSELNQTLPSEYSSNKELAFHGPLDRYATPSSSPRSPSAQAENAHVPQRHLPNDHAVESVQFQAAIDNGAPRPQFETILHAPDTLTNHGDILGNVHQAPLVSESISPCQCVANSFNRQQANNCTDQWANFCNPRRLDWECDCEQFPRPERKRSCQTCQPNRPLANRRNFIRERISTRLHEEYSGASSCNLQAHPAETSSICQQGECDDQNSACAPQGPGAIGHGLLKRHQVMSILDTSQETEDQAYYNPAPQQVTDLAQRQPTSAFGTMKRDLTTGPHSPFADLSAENVCHRCLTDKNTSGDFCEDCKAYRAEVNAPGIQR